MSALRYYVNTAMLVFGCLASRDSHTRDTVIEIGSKSCSQAKAIRCVQCNVGCKYIEEASFKTEEIYRYFLGNRNETHDLRKRCRSEEQSHFQIENIGVFGAEGGNAIDIHIRDKPHTTELIYRPHNVQYPALVGNEPLIHYESGNNLRVDRGAIMDFWRLMRTGLACCDRSEGENCVVTEVEPLQPDSDD